MSKAKSNAILYLDRILRFLRDIHVADSNVSSKRFYGGVTYLMGSLFIVSVQRELMKELLLVSATLIGLDSAFKGLSNIVNSHNEKNSGNS